MRRIVLIGRREIIAYASAPSFWVALFIGPLLMVLATLGAKALSAGPTAAITPIALVAADPALAAAATRSLTDAASLEHRAVAVGDQREAKGPKTTLRLTASPAGGVAVQVDGDRLSDLTLALLRRDLAGSGAAPVQARPVAIVQPPLRPAIDPGRFGRFSLTTLLWLVLVGSLGMLLQAIVRERSNRALESLLSAAQPAEIIVGKLAGVGALSILVVSAWLAGGALMAASPIGGTSPGAGLLLHGFGDPVALTAGGLLFLMAFAMYGSALIGLGALAADVPAAQNLSRPVFGVLLMVFFLALGQLVGIGGDSLTMLVMVPPFAPFVLMLAKPGSIGVFQAVAGVAGMGLTTLICIWLASLALKGERPRLSARRAPAAP